MAQRTRPGEAGLAAPPLVFCPAIAPGLGLGHLKRALALLEAAGTRGFLLLDHRQYEARPEIRELIARLTDRLAPERIIFDPKRVPESACVVFDSRETDPRLLETVAGRAIVAGLDEGGRRRGRFAFLIDIFPMIRRREKSNIRLTPERPVQSRAARRAPFRKILLSFGGEDAADLSRLLLSELLALGLEKTAELSVVEGPLFRKGEWPEGVKVLRGCSSLTEMLGGYDLLFTHYGITAYEALNRGLGVVLFNPSSYHRSLSRHDRIPEIGVGRVNRARLKKLLSDPAGAAEAGRMFRERMEGRQALPEFMCAFSLRGERACPVCGRQSGRALERFESKTYFRCPSCRIVRLVCGGPARDYGPDYFACEYKAQYGKTYLEDFENIKRMGEGRLDIIERIVPRKDKAKRDHRLLDIGAAYGPFLAAARDRGYAGEGLELSEAGAAHIREKLGIPCTVGDFAAELIGVRFVPGSYDIIAMWYVFEHFARTGEVLAKVSRLLRPGGLVCLATPSLGGISFRKNRRRFLEQSPDDHFTLWSPRRARRALRRFGFRVKRIRVTGHHPERIWKRAASGPLAAALSGLSRLFGLGDTCEIYAVKERECP